MFALLASGEIDPNHLKLYFKKMTLFLLSEAIRLPNTITLRETATDVEPFKKNISRILLNKDNLQATMFYEEENTTDFYLDIISLIVNKTYVENILKDNMFNINPVLLMQIISYSTTGSSTKVREKQEENSYTK